MLGSKMLKFEQPIYGVNSSWIAPAGANTYFNLILFLDKIL